MIFDPSKLIEEDEFANQIVSLLRTSLSLPVKPKTHMTELQTANHAYQQKKNEVNHHQVHGHKCQTKTASYLDSLSSNAIMSELHSTSYLDSLTVNIITSKVDKTEPVKNDKTKITKNLLTWANYKHRTTELQSKKSEINCELVASCSLS